MRDDYERLKHLTATHDLAAAALLQRAAQRRADAPAEALAAAALADVASLLQGGADAWSVPALTAATLDALAAIRSRCNPNGATPSLTLTIANTKLYLWQVEAGIYAPRPTLPPDLFARLRDAVLCDWELISPN